MIKVYGKTTELRGVEPFIMSELSGAVCSIKKYLIKRGASEEIAKEKIMYAVELGLKNEEELAVEAEKVRNEFRENIAKMISDDILENLMKGFGE